MDLKSKRITQRLTQKQVADAAGIKVGSYCDIENGKKGTKPATAQRIAAVLGFDWTEFYKADPTEQDGSGAGGRNDRNPEVAAQKDERHAHA